MAVSSLSFSALLVKDCTLKAVKLDERDESIKKLIEETKKQQEFILKLKDISQDKMKMVVRL